VYKREQTQTLGNSSNVGLRAGYLSACTAGDTSDRRLLKARLINRLTYLHTYWRCRFPTSEPSLKLEYKVRVAGKTKLSSGV